MGRVEYSPLFETRRCRGRFIYRSFAISLFVAICFIWHYRFSHITKGEDGNWAWLGMLASELWFGFYWVLTQALRWNLVFRQPFKNRLSQRYEKKLPRVDIFVCTADPDIEPAMMVINTVLSVMAYDYPTEKLSVYLSDDAGSQITFYALLEASNFAKHWVPFCKRFKVEPRSPSAYFKSLVSSGYPTDPSQAKELGNIKKLYDEMEKRIEDATKFGEVAKEARLKHMGFSQWDSYSSRRDHDTILQILLHRKDHNNSKDVDGFVLPALVYLAREKRPQYFHNFKAGAMNSLLRVSSNISNGKIILNVDCDMYSNNSQSVRDALCFFMDEEKGQEIAYVQFPQTFENATKNDLYGGSLTSILEVEFPGLDGYGGPLYAGTGCFHKRESLCGMKFSDQYCNDWNSEDDQFKEANLQELEQQSKVLASCNYEENTLWGKEMGLKYGCPVEDVITGLSIQCQGWKSVYYNPPRKAFLGLAPTTLPQTLVQHKRWSEGDLQILLSKYSPAWYGFGRINFGLQMGYSVYCLWAPNCLATLYYSIIPSLYLLKGIPLFPKISSPWFIPFAYVIVGETTYSLLEFFFCGGTFQGWWNDQRIWLYKRTSSYLFACIDTILKLFGFSESTFTITTKVTEEDASKRHEKEIMEFGTSSPMLTVLATLALLNLFCFLSVLKDAILGEGDIGAYETMGLQVLLCGFLVFINLPIYQGLFLRKDNGRLPSSIAIKSIVFALGVFISFIFT
ncbi:cellulose synthase-like protein E1 [Glycine soja]|uniref:Cellulose synthase-like protein E1 n=2 Tax=Glycine soja TaxID=3848 RepID=A0A445JNE2_GLYSO|nr:cellulose synthase-like protein E1 [Glycine soja]RZB99986.1 Cellulose synthase-like protein E1 [Glycine soja]